MKDLWMQVLPWEPKVCAYHSNSPMQLAKQNLLLSVNAFTLLVTKSPNFIASSAEVTENVYLYWFII